MPAAFNGSSAEPGIDDSVRERCSSSQRLHIELWVDDTETINAIRKHPEGRARQDYIQSALKVGVLCLQQAHGHIEGDRVKNEGERLISALQSRFEQYQEQISSELRVTLSRYFNPDDGHFTERVERLVKRDGDLERLMRAQIDAAALALKQSLENQVGPGSSFARLLTPDESNALLTAIRNNVDGLICEQKSKTLAEFSLDNKDSALSRLLSELTVHHGRITDDLKKNIAEVAAEFSLDKDDSALSRLVKRVEEAQQKISDEFTLDKEESALFRMRRELSDVIETMHRESREFQEKVMSALAAITARREEKFASTRHGKDFERNVYEFIEDNCQKAGDVSEEVGDRPGEIKYCKIGDFLITLGPDCNAAGARIVCEAKEDASYDLPRSLDEIKTARKNRKAEVGLFIHSSRTARSGLKPLARYGNDIVVVWNADDEQSDPYLLAALMICKAIAIRQTLAAHEVAADFDLLDRSIREVERQAGYLDEIKTSSSTIKSGAEKILARVETMRSALIRQIESLDTQAGLLRQIVSCTGQPQITGSEA